MRSYAERVIFHETVMAVWADAVSLVARVSDRHGNEVRCHELARAALGALTALNERKLYAANASLMLVDGNLWSIEHSWLLYRWNDETTPKSFILDTYCPGRLPQVQLLDGEHFAIARGYAKGEMRTDINESMVEQLTREMQRGT